MKTNFKDLKKEIDFTLAERTRCLKAVDDEPELTDAMPEEMESALQRLFLIQDWEAIMEAFRINDDASYYCRYCEKMIGSGLLIIGFCSNIFLTTTAGSLSQRGTF
jgi:hypothetical protein